MNTHDAAPPDPGVPPGDNRGPAVDVLDLPVQQPSRALAYVWVAGSVICAAVPAGLIANGFAYRNLTIGMTAIGLGIGILPLAVEAVAAVQARHGAVGRIAQLKLALGPVSQRVLKYGTIAATIVAFFCLIGLTPGDWTTG